MSNRRKFIKQVIEVDEVGERKVEGDYSFVIE